MDILKQYIQSNLVNPDLLNRTIRNPNTQKKKPFNLAVPAWSFTGACVNYRPAMLALWAMYECTYNLSLDLIKHTHLMCFREGFKN